MVGGVVAWEMIESRSLERLLEPTNDKVEGHSKERSDEQPLNAEAPIEVTPSGMAIALNDVQLENALLGILVRL